MIHLFLVVYQYTKLNLCYYFLFSSYYNKFNSTHIFKISTFQFGYLLMVIYISFLSNNVLHFADM